MVYLGAQTRCSSSLAQVSHRTPTRRKLDVMNR